MLSKFFEKSINPTQNVCKKANDYYFDNNCLMFGVFLLILWLEVKKFYIRTIITNL